MAEAPEFEEFPSGWEDGAIVGSVKRNRDGSITVSIQIYVDGDGNHYEAYRKVRLERS